MNPHQRQNANKVNEPLTLFLPYKWEIKNAETFIALLTESAQAAFFNNPFYGMEEAEKTGDQR